MTVGKFYEGFIQREAEASVKLDGETWSLPRFQMDQPVWAASRPATVVGYLEAGGCPGHPGQYRYQVRFLLTGTNYEPWPYCESQLLPRD